MFILKKTHEAIMADAQDLAKHYRTVYFQVCDQLHAANVKATEMQKALDRQAQALNGYVRHELRAKVKEAEQALSAAHGDRAGAKAALVAALNAKRSPSYATTVLDSGTAHNNALNTVDVCRTALLKARKELNDHVLEHGIVD